MTFRHCEHRSTWCFFLPLLFQNPLRESFFFSLSSLFKGCCFSPYSVLNLLLAGGKVGEFSSVKLSQFQLIGKTCVCLLVDVVRSWDIQKLGHLNKFVYWASSLSLILLYLRGLIWTQTPTCYCAKFRTRVRTTDTDRNSTKGSVLNDWVDTASQRKATIVFHNSSTMLTHADSPLQSGEDNDTIICLLWKRRDTQKTRILAIISLN